MRQLVEQTIRRYGMFAPGQRVGVAVSGGADSVCLLAVLLELVPAWNLRLEVLHLDHQLRGAESETDAEFVREMAAGLGLQFHLRRLPVGALAAGENLEQAARRARQEFYFEFLKAGRLERVALGHTRSDQAETVLFRLLRGAGTAGLAGIWPVTPEGLVRPLIEVERREVLAYLSERGLRWREDSSNQDRSFARNRIRHELLPQLTAEWNPSLAETLAQTAVLAREDEEYWGRELDRLAASELRVWGGAVLLRAGALSGYPAAVGRRLVRRALELVRGDLRGIEFTHIERVMALARRPGGHGRLQAPGLSATRSFDWIKLAPPGGESPAGYRLPLAVPGRYLIPAAEVEISLEFAEAETRYNTEGRDLDWNRVPGPLVLRNWQAGDRYQPAGRQGEVRLKRWFQRTRVPLWVRRIWPIITGGDAIVWAGGLGPSAGLVAGPDARKALRIRQQGDLAAFLRP